jgi:putative ABC transport system permease protein
MPSDRDDDLRREIEAHLELEVEERVADGMSSEVARYFARREFGNVLRVREDARALWVAPWLDRTLQDLRYAGREFRRTPAVPLAIVLTTALAVGINLAMVGLIDRALLSPPAHVVDPERVFTVAFETTGPSGEKGLVATTSVPSFEAIRAAVPNAMSAAWTVSGTSVTIGERRFAAKAMAVTRGYFEMLGVRARKGRTLLADDEASFTGATVAVLSHSLWQRAFGGDERALGSRLELGGLELDIVGVMPPGFSGHSAEQTDVWIPMRTAMRDRPGWEAASTFAFAEIGVRLAADQSVSAAASQLSAAAGARVVLWPVIGADVAPAPHQIAMWLAGMSLVVLMAGLTNVATLSIVRNARRRREASIRTWLGATRARLAGQILIESAVVACVATAVAVVLGFWLDEIVRRLLFPFLVESTGVTHRVLATAVLSGVCTFLVAAGAGILQLPGQVGASRRAMWRRGGRGARRRELLIVQTTLAVLLLTAAGMIGQKYFGAIVSDQYARLDDVIVAEFGPGPRSMAVSEQEDLFISAVDRVRAVPGVAAATVFFVLPYYNMMAPPIDVPGRGETRIDGELPFLIESTPELLDILQVEIVRGRRFAAGDNESAPPVAIVSEAMARAVWPGTSALGRCFRIGLDLDWDPRTAKRPPTPPASAPCREIVGIARDWQPPLDSPQGRPIAHYYVPFAQGLRFPPRMGLPRVSGLVLKPEPGVDLSADAIRRAAAGGRDNLPFLEVRPFAVLQGPRLAHWLMGTKLLLLFGALALATAAIGIHAAFAHSVAQRRHEIAVRIAVGASRRDVLSMVLREGGLIAGRGLISGILVAILAGWSARSVIVGLENPRPEVIALTCSLVLLVAVLATWLPALSASRIEPGTLLRSE